MAMPVLLFPFSFLTPLATLLLPEVTRAHILGRRRTLETLVGRIMLFTNLFSVLAGGLIALNAAPLARLLYRDESVGLYLLVLAPVLPGMYLDAMGDSILKGLGLSLIHISSAAVQLCSVRAMRFSPMRRYQYTANRPSVRNASPARCKAAPRPTPPRRWPRPAA